jgi:Ser/Thr protein kinase RdoA (MazF antagonist)
MQRVAPLEVDHSVPTAKAIAGLVDAGYDLGGLRGCDLLSHGANDLFAVTADGGRFVLRVGPARDPLAERTASGLGYELDLLSHLSARGFPCPEPVQCRDGRRWLVVLAFLRDAIGAGDWT